MSTYCVFFLPKAQSYCKFGHDTRSVPKEICERVKPLQVLLGEVVKSGWIGDLKGGILAHSLNFAVLGTV